MRVLIFDVETTGVDPAVDQVIEVGAVLWDSRHSAMVGAYSELVRLQPPHKHGAEFVHGISEGLLKSCGAEASEVWEVVEGWADLADALVAHNAIFDRSFSKKASEFLDSRDWICTLEDFEWPKQGTSNSLTEIALRHGIAVVSAHRAINDCLVLQRLFEQIPDTDARLEEALVRSREPKAEFVALVPYQEREKAKAAGFIWNGEKKEWRKRMRIASAKDLPFRTRQVGEV